MNELLSKHVDNLSEIYKKECKVCMERRKIRSECDFIGLANNKFHYKCKECKRRCLISINGLIKKFPSVYQWRHYEIFVVIKKLFLSL